MNVVFLSDDEDAAWVDAEPVSRHGPLFVGSGLVCIIVLKYDEVRGASCSS